MTESDVNEILANDGFVRMTEKTLRERYRAEFERGDWIFSREANTIFCNINAYVILRFDGDRTLVSAQGTVSEHGCL
jgi:hypothetical protein